MSDFHVEVCEVKKVYKHPDADALKVCEVNGNPVIFNFNDRDYKEGDKVAYIPVDSVTSEDERFSFLGPGTRIKAKRLRGIFSMGLIIPANPEWEIGQNVQEELGITKYEPPIDRASMGGNNVRDPGWIPRYTDIEGYRRFKDKGIFQEGEEVSCSIKIHGANSRYSYKEGKLWVGSKQCLKAYDESNLWWKIALQYNLEEKCEQLGEDFALYGEVYGSVQDLRYGAKPGELFFAAFDILNLKDNNYLDVDVFNEKCKELDIPTVPIVYRGPYNLSFLEALAEEKDIYNGQKQVREGIVVKPIHESYDHRIGRRMFKIVGESYLLRKQKEE